MTVTIEAETTLPFDFDCFSLAREVIAYALAQEGFPYEAEVGLCLTDNASIQRINRKYRDLDRPTDVLSFPMLQYPSPGDFSVLAEEMEGNFNPDTEEALLGDIILSVPKVLEQANAYGHSARREYAFLIVHSVLHLLGYDHMTPEDAACMEQKQEAILTAMHIVR